jgi:hypothetical protein
LKRLIEILNESAIDFIKNSLFDNIQNISPHKNGSIAVTLKQGEQKIGYIVFKEYDDEVDIFNLQRLNPHAGFNVPTQFVKEIIKYCQMNGKKPVVVAPVNKEYWFHKMGFRAQDSQSAFAEFP